MAFSIIRPATIEDASEIAALHTQSWQNHYRGAFSDVYLDQHADQERLGHWQKVLAETDPASATFVFIYENQLGGFIHLKLHHHDQYGILLDNLHVDQAFRGKGLGKQLIQFGTEFASVATNNEGIYLYVLCQNEAAIGVYEHLGGKQQEKLMHHSPMGNEVAVYRYVWESVDELYRRVS